MKGFDNSRRIAALVCSLAVGAQGVTARTIPSVCGTHRDGLKEELYLSRAAREASSAPSRVRKARLAQLATQGDIDSGDIALIGSGGGVVAQRNPFNLQGRTLGFLPASAGATSYGFTVDSGGFDQGAAENGQPLTGLGDDDYREMELPFAFPFFGRTYERVFVHSDGNLTFEEPDPASASRSLGRMTAGPPRIAPQFADLDPSRAPNSVRYAALPYAFIVTWYEVPEYSDFGFAARQTVQAVLYPDGAIQLTLRNADIGNVVTGIAPGRLRSPTSVVSFIHGSSEIYAGAVVERFGITEAVDTTLAAQRFYLTHEDSYDYLVFFNALNVQAGPNALASELTVRSVRKGIGDSPTEAGAQFGSAYRLQAVLNMGPLSQYPSDPYAPVGLRGLITGDNTMTILGHETGHLFLALASTRDQNFPDERPMLGSGLAHWSFNFNSEASLLEGNRIQDNGPTQINRFITIGTVEGFSPLDQYLMGLRAPEDVPSTFVVHPANTPASQLPRTGAVIRGTRQDINILDLINAEGTRIPDHTVEQRRYRFAFILIVPEGQAADPAWLEQVERYRQEFVPFIDRVTERRSAADPTLKKMLRVSGWPATGVVAGSDARLIVETAKPVESDLQITLHPADGITPPRSVTIPAGSYRAEFLVQGVRAGTGDLTLDPSDPAYETVHLRLPIAERKDNLRVTLYYHGWSTVLRVVDANEVPYSNVHLAIVESTGEVTAPNGLTTDEAGFVYLDFLPGDAAVQTITAEIAGAPATRVVLTIPEL